MPLSTKQRHSKNKGLAVGNSLSYRVLSGGQVEIRDLDFAAFCHIKGLSSVDTQCTGGGPRPRNYKFIFHDPDNRVVKLATAFVNSEAAEHANAVRTLKRVARVISDTKF